MKKNIKIDEEVKEPRVQVDVVQLDEENIRISKHPYKLIENYRDGFDREKLAERYSDVLKKYDYIVGDWGYDQLRLKGFFNKNYSQAKMDQRIENVEDYLLEYCNFGCAYFVLENLKKMPKSKLKKVNNSNKKGQPKQKNTPKQNNKNSVKNENNQKNTTKKNNNKKRPAKNNKPASEKTEAKPKSNQKRKFNIRKINEEK
ncbi:transcriptional regulator [Companilactobacillus sp. RD055328]|uniref:YutD family protein n=1 Tax=Companilactobacillus sp. RD055328 TaxID=2916634 RepID=UPI001FC8B7E3|nr:YutD family protein [Companilactobacillus sp. RD055328]GKQ42083.1 transcriptional regulator [Companilactobacillus sp. RD055328]